MIKAKDYFTPKNTIGWVGDNFKEHFFDMEVVLPKKFDVKAKKLERDMLDKEILEEFKPKEMTLGEFAYALKHSDILLKDGYANIFYIRDSKNVLWAVSAYWGSYHREWGVHAGSVEDPFEWFAGRQLLSSDWDFEPKISDTLTLEPFESMKIIEIEWNGKKWRLVE